MKYPIDQFASWLENKGLQQRTVEEYLYYFNKFSTMGLFNQENVSKFIFKKDNRNVVAKAFLKNLQKFLMVNYKELGIDKDARIDISEVELPTISGRTKARLIKPLSEEQILHLEKFLPGEREKLQLLVTFYGGLRAGEMLRIKVISFNWEEWKKDMTQYCEVKVFGKGNKERLAFLNPEITKRIARFIREKKFPSLDSYLFLIRTTQHPINFHNRQSIWNKSLHKAGLKSGIVQRDDNGKIIDETRVHPHKLRHSYGYYLKNVKKFDIRDIQVILGHSSIESTQRYTYTDRSDIKDLLKNSEIKRIEPHQ